MTGPTPGSTVSWFGPVEPTDSPVPGPDPAASAGDVDGGRAILEVVFLAVLMLVPIIYLLLSLLRLQAATLAVTQAARDAGRAIDAAPTIAEGIARAQTIAAIDLADQNIPAGGIDLHFVNAGSSCTGDAITPTLAAGATYDVCVTTALTLPGVPTVVTGSNNTVTGVYTISISPLREGP